MCVCDGVGVGMVCVEMFTALVHMHGGVPGARERVPRRLGELFGEK